jgi:hypothetical protein
MLGARLASAEVPGAWERELEGLYALADDLAMDLGAPTLRTLRVVVLRTAAEVRLAAASPGDAGRRILEAAVARLGASGDPDGSHPVPGAAAPAPLLRAS